MADWFRIAVVIPHQHVEDVSAQLFEMGCGGVHEDEVDQGVCLIAYFEDVGQKDTVRASCSEILTKLGRATELLLEDVPNEDWTTSWRDYFKPVFATDRILICPPWACEPAPENGFVILIDPKMAFGTGHHETTRLALAGLEACIMGGEHVLDVGTGSGILSIAAMKLGATSVEAVDTDPPAVENTQDNMVLNDVLSGVQVQAGSLSVVDGTFDVVVANIISSILGPLLPEIAIRTKSNGRVVLGGILEREREAFCQMVTDAGFAIDQVLELGEWICVLGHKK